MKSNLRWSWPILTVAIVILVLWGLYATRPTRVLDVAVLDKTVPYKNRIEHRSLYWLLDHLKIVKPDGNGYDRDADYLGAFPGPTPGDPPERTKDLNADRARSADLIYLADTYGVYRDDLLSGPLMKAALERSPKIYGGLTLAESEAARSAVSAGKTLIAEFNTLGSPTPDDARHVLEEALGVRWTRWIGRFFPDLSDKSEVPEWMRRDYEREWKQLWEFKGPGYVLMQDDAHCEVLRVGPESKHIGLTIEREAPADRLLSHASGRIPYPYWFDIVTIDPGAKVLASFQWHLEAKGLERLKARGLPERFPAVVRRLHPGVGTTYYFAGDFADNPMPDGRVPFVGYLTARRWIERGKLAPSELAFYWRFYVPMMANLLNEVKHR